MLAGIHRSLKPDGLYLAQDIAASSNVADNVEHPLGPMIYTISCMHCMTVSLAQGGLGVGAAWGEQMTMDFIREAGFGECVRHKLPHDIQILLRLPPVVLPTRNPAPGSPGCGAAVRVR
jgi:hypothetical protein